MLKFLFYGIMIMGGFNSWLGVQVMLFSGSLLFSLNWVGSSGLCLLGQGLGADGVSGVLILLSFWIGGLVLMASQKCKDGGAYCPVFLVTNLLLIVTLVLSFSCENYLGFYIFFEATLIPTMILIVGWGYQPERVEAGVYMLFYTLFASLPLLVSLLFMYKSEGTLMMGLIREGESDCLEGSVLYFCVVFAFLVKLPMFGAHIWLPKAHVEAPISGSMVLAGVLLKLGGYGLIRVLGLVKGTALSYSWVLVSVSLVSGVSVSLLCLRQSDIKSLIAYSSVVHMGLVLIGLSVLSDWGLSGALVVMIGHGLCSSGLFCLANISYERTMSRSLFISKGLLGFMPSVGLWWFLMTVGNMAAPPSLNMLGEISVILSLTGWSEGALFGVGLVLFLSVSYSLYMYSLAQHGWYIRSFSSNCSGKVREYLLMIMHWLPLNVLTFSSSLLF